MTGLVRVILPVRVSLRTSLVYVEQLRHQRLEEESRSKCL